MTAECVGECMSACNAEEKNMVVTSPDVFGKNSDAVQKNRPEDAGGTSGKIAAQVYAGMERVPAALSSGTE